MHRCLSLDQDPSLTTRPHSKSGLRTGGSHDIDAKQRETHPGANHRTSSLLSIGLPCPPLHICQLTRPTLWAVSASFSIPSALCDPPSLPISHCSAEVLLSPYHLIDGLALAWSHWEVEPFGSTARPHGRLRSSGYPLRNPSSLFLLCFPAMR